MSSDIGTVTPHTDIVTVISPTDIGTVISPTDIGTVISPTDIGTVISPTDIGIVISPTDIGTVMPPTDIGTVIFPTDIGTVKPPRRLVKVVKDGKHIERIFGNNLRPPLVYRYSVICQCPNHVFTWMIAFNHICCRLFSTLLYSILNTVSVEMSMTGALFIHFT